MQVLFETRHQHALALRDLAVSRTLFALRRLRWMVPRARILMDDINGPRGGVDKRCRIALQAPSGHALVVTSTAADWRSALDAALSRAVRALLRRWQRTANNRQPLARRPAIR